MTKGDFKTIGKTMKHSKLTIFVVILSILSTLAYAQVAISPSSPNDNDNLVCSFNGVSSNAYLYTWDSQPYTSSSILSSATSSGQTWTCHVYANIAGRRISYGSASVNIASNPVIQGPDTTPPTISSIVVSRKNSSAVINWTTNEASNTSLRYGLTIKRFSPFVLLHSVSLTSLTPVTNYTYVVSSCDSSGNCRSSNNLTFITKPNPHAPNIHGTITDTISGAPISGANISFYDDSFCHLDDITLEETGNCTFNPKPVRDTVSDVNGHYSFYLLPGLHHMLVRHSKQVENNIITNDSTDVQIDQELKENQIDKNVNFEGHIIYGGNYRNGNKYVMGDVLTFVMFGVDNAPASNNPVNVTYLIEDETSGGNSGPWVLNGTYSNFTQVLSVNSSGNKVNKIFNVTLDSRFDKPGRYDVHVMYNNAGTLEKWHKIGNFFIVGLENASAQVINGTANITDSSARIPPALKFRLDSLGYYINNNSIVLGQYMNQTFNTTFQVKVPPQNGTIPNVLAASESDGSSNPDKCTFTSGPGDEVQISAPNSVIFLNGQNRTSIFRINVTNDRSAYCSFVPTFFYSVSDRYKINVSVKERYYGVISSARSVNATIWASEQLARDIYYDITQIDLGLRPVNKPVNFTGFYRGDHCSGTGGYCADSTFNVNRSGTGPTGGILTSDVFSTYMGFEYRSISDGYDYESSYCNPVAVNLTGATNCERDFLNNRWHIPSIDYILVIDPMTKDDVAKKVTTFAQFIVVNNSITTV